MFLLKRISRLLFCFMAISIFFPVIALSAEFSQGEMIHHNNGKQYRSINWDLIYETSFCFFCNFQKSPFLDLNIITIGTFLKSDEILGLIDEEKGYPALRAPQGSIASTIKLIPSKSLSESKLLEEVKKGNDYVNSLENNGTYDVDPSYLILGKLNRDEKRGMEVDDIIFANTHATFWTTMWNNKKAIITIYKLIKK